MSFSFEYQCLALIISYFEKEQLSSYYLSSLNEDQIKNEAINEVEKPSNSNDETGQANNSHFANEDCEKKIEKDEESFLSDENNEKFTIQSQQTKSSRKKPDNVKFISTDSEDFVDINLVGSIEQQLKPVNEMPTNNLRQNSVVREEENFEDSENKYSIENKQFSNEADQAFENQVDNSTKTSHHCDSMQKNSGNNSINSKNPLYFELKIKLKEGKNLAIRDIGGNIMFSVV